MKTRNITVMLLAFTLALGACKSDNKTEQNGTPAIEHTKAGKVLEPEMLISKDEAAELLGEAVQNGKKSETAVVGMKLCIYNAVDPSSSNYLQVSLTQDSFMPPEGVGSEKIYRELKKMFADSKHDVTELGSEAFIATGGLYLFKDGYYIMISAGNNIRNDQTIAILKAAGKKALDRLEKIR
jgi:glyoxylate carboligase